MQDSHVVDSHEFLIEIGTNREGKRVFTSPFVVTGKAVPLDPQKSLSQIEHTHALSDKQGTELLLGSIRRK